MTLEEQDSTNRLEQAKANLERLRKDINARRTETFRRDLSLDIRHAIAERATKGPIAKGYSNERVRITNDLLRHSIEFQIDRVGESRKLTLSWSTDNYITAVCNRFLISAIEISVQESRPNIVSDVTRKMFVDKCIGALGFEVLKEAA